MAFNFGLAHRQQLSFWSLKQCVPKIQARSQHHVVSVSQFTRLQLNKQLQLSSKQMPQAGD